VVYRQLPADIEGEENEMLKQEPKDKPIGPHKSTGINKKGEDKREEQARDVRHDEVEQGGHTTLDHWDYYRQKDFSIFPTSSDKKPIIKWRFYQTRYPTTTEIAEWKRIPQSNIAIVTGKLSNLTVIDADSPDAIAELEALNSGGVRIPQVHTPRGGRHYYCQHHEELSRNSSGRGKSEKIDVRSEGGFVLCPPGKTNDGRYQWDKDLNLETVPLPKVPKNWVYLLHPDTARGSVRDKDQGPKLVEGRRDNDIFRMACTMRREGFSIEQAKSAAIALAKECDPPFDEREALKKVESAWSYDEKTVLRLDEPMTIMVDEVQHARRGDDISIYSLGEFLQKEIPDREIIMRYHAEKESVSMLAGKQKQGKSLYAMQMGLCVAEGKDFLGFTVVQPRKVLYYQQEISEAAMQERLNKMIQSSGDLLSGNLLIKNTVGYLLKITERSHREKIHNEIEEHKPDLVIFDPLSTFHNKKENDDKHMSEVMDAFCEIALRHSCGVFIIHHYGKPSLAAREGGHLLRGHTVLGDRPDAIINFNELPKQYKFTRLPLPFQNYAELAFTLRNDAAPDNLVIERNPETLWYWESHLLTELGRKILPEQVKRMVQENGGEMRYQEAKDELLKYASHRIVIRAVQQAVEKGYIEEDKLQERGNPKILRIRQGE